jgi:hypothetical protein
MWRYRQDVVLIDVVITGFDCICKGMSCVWNVGRFKSDGFSKKKWYWTKLCIQLLCVKELCQMWTVFLLSFLWSRRFFSPLFVRFTQEEFSCFQCHYWYLCHAWNYHKWLSIFAQFAFHSWYVGQNTSSWFLHINQYFFSMRKMKQPAPWNW